MSEEINKAQDDKKEAEQAQAKQSTAEAKAPKAGGRFRYFFTLLVALVSLAGMGLLAYLFTEQDKTLEVLFTQQNTLFQQEEISAAEQTRLQDNMQGLTTALSQAEQLVTEQSVELERLNREVISTRLRINDDGTINNQVWTLSEAESLLRLAQQRLIISHDSRAALALVLASDDILKQINDPAIFSVRNILASDIAALRAVKEVDVQGIYLQLGALSQQVDALQVSSGMDVRLSSSGGDTGTSAAEEEAEGFFSDMFKTLSQYLVVRRRDEAIQPLLTSEQNFFIKQNINLLLQQAKISLLQEREQIFHSSIQQAIKNIEQYLESANTEKQNIIESLTSLTELSIIVHVPTLSNSLTALRQILPMPVTQTDQVGEE